MLPDSRRLEGVIHSDGIAQLLDIGAQPHTHCQTAADMQASPTVTASLSCDIDTRAATPALPGRRRLEGVTHSDGVAQLLDNARSHARAATHGHAARTAPWRVALLHTRRHEVIHTDSVAQLLDVDAQPHPHCQTAADLKTSSTATASLSC